jgi:hypothetical protein
MMSNRAKLQVSLKKDKGKKISVFNNTDQFFIVTVSPSAQTDTCNPMKWYRKHISVHQVKEEKANGVHVERRQVWKYLEKVLT